MQLDDTFQSHVLFQDTHDPERPDAVSLGGWKIQRVLGTQAGGRRFLRPARTSRRESGPVTLQHDCSTLRCLQDGEMNTQQNPGRVLNLRGDIANVGVCSPSRDARTLVTCCSGRPLTAGPWLLFTPVSPALSTLCRPTYTLHRYLLNKKLMKQSLSPSLEMQVQEHPLGSVK